MITIVKKKGKCEIGQNQFSDTDVRKINTLYRCEGYPQVGKGVTAGPTVSPYITPKPSCEDNHKWCKWWAGNGECKKNPSWMLVNCPKSCDQCGRPVRTVILPVSPGQTKGGATGVLAT